MLLSLLLLGAGPGPRRGSAFYLPGLAPVNFCEEEKKSDECKVGEAWRSAPCCRKGSRPGPAAPGSRVGVREGVEQWVGSSLARSSRGRQLRHDPRGGPWRKTSLESGARPACGVPGSAKSCLQFPEQGPCGAPWSWKPAGPRAFREPGSLSAPCSARQESGRPARGSPQRSYDLQLLLASLLLDSLYFSGTPGCLEELVLSRTLISNFKISS